MRRATSSKMAVDRQLIALVRRRPALYDVEDEMYQDTVHKAGLWHDIAREIGMDARLCRSRWFNMRDNHRKSLIRNQMKRRAGQALRVYKYARDMTFLNKYFSNLSQDSDQEAPPSEHTTPDDNDGDADAQIYNHTASAVDRVNYTVSTVSADVPPRASHPATPAHPVDVFLACIEPTLKALPPYLLSLAKGEIFAAVQKYELRMLNPLEDKFLRESDGELSDQK